MKRIAIFASGEGTNTERIINYFLHNSNINVELVISNKVNSGVISRAKRLDKVAITLTSSDLNGPVVIDVLKKHKIDFIVLAGYLARVSDEIMHIYPNRIINIHPALLPKYGGKGMYGMNVHKAVIEAGEKESGITIHYINKEYDKGEIIFQGKCPVLDDDTPESLAARVHKLEYQYYPVIIEDLINRI